MATIPEPITNPLYNKPAEASPADIRKLWEAVQQLQRVVNDVIDYLEEETGP